MGLGALGIFVRPFASCFAEDDAVHRTCRRAERAARAALCHDRMQVLGRAGDGACRAGFDAPAAADAVRSADLRDGKRHFPAVFWIERHDRQTCRSRELGNAAGAAGRAAVDGRCALRNGFRIGGAAAEAALAALRLGKKRIDFIGADRTGKRLTVLLSHEQSGEGTGRTWEKRAALCGRAPV